MKTCRIFYYCLHLSRMKATLGKILFCLVIIMSVKNNSFGQLQLVNSDFSIVQNDSMHFTGICNVTISDTTDCNAIQVAMIDELNDITLLNHQFEFDQNTGLPAGMSWARNGNEINLSLGVFQSNSIYKIRVRLKDGSNQWTSWEEFIFN